MSISKIEAILSLKPNAQFVTVEDEITEWHSEDITQPTDAEITSEQTRLQTEYDTNEYQRDRALAYPQISEQLDKLFHDIDDGLLGEDAKTGSLYLALKEVKDDNPKPSE
tara:strand:- start:41 stop:370 length:330 start_codon:yes stop_codon:yes gene_type:complete